MTRNVDWVVNNDIVKKYGNIDRTKIVAAGHGAAVWRPYQEHIATLES